MILMVDERKAVYHPGGRHMTVRRPIPETEDTHLSEGRSSPR